MDRETIDERLRSAYAELCIKQSSLFNFTPDTSQSEWNLRDHLCVEIRNVFPGYDCDVDLVKPTAGNRRPDFVVHERGHHAGNLIAGEIKRNPRHIGAEIHKIKRFWFGPPYLYQFGAVIVVENSFDFYCEVFSNPLHPKNSACL